MMLVKNSGREVSHNVQIAVDEKNHLVVAADVTSVAMDREQLHNISMKAKEELGMEEITIIADKGYYSAKQSHLCEEDKIKVIAPKPLLKTAPDENYVSRKRFLKNLICNIGYRNQMKCVLI